MAYQARTHSPSRHRNRHLRRAWRRPELGRVLLSRGHELRLLLTLPRADRALGGGAGGDLRRRQVGEHAHHVAFRFLRSRLGNVDSAPRPRGGGGLPRRGSRQRIHNRVLLDQLDDLGFVLDALVVQHPELVFSPPRISAFWTRQAHRGNIFGRILCTRYTQYYNTMT